MGSGMVRELLWARRADLCCGNLARRDPNCQQSVVRCTPGQWSYRPEKFDFSNFTLSCDPPENGQRKTEQHI